MHELREPNALHKDPETGQKKATEGNRIEKARLVAGFFVGGKCCC
jgi:hypothetical protein